MRFSKSSDNKKETLEPGRNKGILHQRRARTGRQRRARGKIKQKKNNGDARHSDRKLMVFSRKERRSGCESGKARQGRERKPRQRYFSRRNRRTDWMVRTKE